jgi:PWWP domain
MSRKRKSIPQSPAAVAAAKAKKVDDQLGTLPPRTLVLALYPRYPYFPALVLSHSEARHQKELTRKVKMLEDGEIIGCCVRFFHADTCDVVSAIAVEPLLVNDEDYRLWIWRSSIAQQQRAGWPTFGDDLLDLWKKAFAEAETYAAKLPRITPYVTKEKRGLGEERGSRQVGFLQPGTIVWAYCKDYPVGRHRLISGSVFSFEAMEGIRMKAIHGLRRGAYPDSFVVGVSTCAFPDMASVRGGWRRPASRG